MVSLINNMFQYVFKFSNLKFIQIFITVLFNEEKTTQKLKPNLL